MAYWIFKVAKQYLYLDVPGEEYVYDNTHSQRVVAGDFFLYLDKGKKCSFTGTGIVNKIKKRSPSRTESERKEKGNYSPYSQPGRAGTRQDVRFSSFHPRSSLPQVRESSR